MPRKRSSIDLSAKKAKPRQGDLEALFGAKNAQILDNVGQLKLLLLSHIEPDPAQPRTAFQDESLKDLAKSIKHNGVIQPIEVVQIGRNQYRIIHGERRWRASHIAEKTNIPAIIKRRDYDEVTRFVRQLVENIQREDLNDIDRAAGLSKLHDMMQEEFNAKAEKNQTPWSSKMTMSKVAERIGYSRQRVNQLIKLLTLPEEIQQSIRDGVLSERDTRVFSKLDQRQQRALHRARVVNGTLSQAETKRVADYIKRTGVKNVADAIKAVQTGDDKVRKSEVALRQDRYSKQLAQVTKVLSQLEREVGDSATEGINSAEKHQLHLQVQAIQKQVERLIHALAH
ncbi:MAG: ParB/RepB/Spo0J family partition protein [Candidatus Promineifilaceae bacterium]